MAVFDQRGQKVKYQYNAAGNINFGSVQDNQDLALQLEQLEEELTKAREAQAIDKLTAAKASTPLLEAAEEAKKPQPDKNSLLGYLDSAKEVLTGITAAGGIVEALTKAYSVVQGLF
jgi:hypothetical protein